MESKIKSMKQMTFADNVNWIMKGPPEPSPEFENLKFVKITPTVLAALLSRPRKNQKNLSTDEKNNFNSAIEAAIRDDQYQSIAAIHADMSHQMHSMSKPLWRV
jgi:hypothetical protein